MKVSLTGGLGNQMFQLAFSLFKSSGQNVILISNLGKPRKNSLGLPEIASYKLPMNVFLDHQDVADEFSRKTAGYLLRSGIEAQGIEKLKLYKSFTRILGSLVLLRQSKSILPVIASQNIGFDELLVKTRGSIYLGYFQTYFWMLKNEVEILMRNLKLIDESRINNYLERAKREKPIVVHVRLGDYINETKFGIPSKNYYEKAIKFQTQFHKESPIWLFSNEIQKAKEYIPKSFRERLLIVDSEDLDSAEILEIMRNGIGYVIGNSTFSWWAAQLSNTKEAVVCTPKPWFKEIQTPKLLIPEKWIEIDA